jgi:hypothetical protein
MLPLYALVAYCALLHAAAHAEVRLSEPLLPLMICVFLGGLAQPFVPVPEAAPDEPPISAV